MKRYVKTTAPARFWFSLAVVLVSFLLAGYFAYESAVLVSRGKRVEAVCTKIDVKTTGSSTSRTYHVTYPVAGQGTIHGTIHAGFSRLPVGGRIDVLYDPLQPSRVEANRFECLWGLVCVCTALGLLFVPSLFRKQRATTNKPRTQHAALKKPRGAVQALPNVKRRLVMMALVALLLLGAAFWAASTYLPGHTLPVHAIAVSADGAKLLSAGGTSNGAEILLWDNKRQQKLLRVRAGDGQPNWIRFAGPDQSKAVMSCRIEGESYDDYPPNQVVIVDLNRGDQIAAFDEPDSLADTLVLQGSAELVCRAWNSLTLYDLDGKQTETLLSGSDLRLRQAAVSADELILAVVGKDQVYVWDLQARAELPPLKLETFDFDQLAISPDGNVLAVSLQSDRYGQTEFPVYVWDRQAQTDAVSTILLDHPATHLRFVAGEPPRLLLASGRDHRQVNLDLYSLRGERLHEIYQGQASIESWDLSPDGSRLVFGLQRAGGVELWDLLQDPPRQVWRKQPFAHRTSILSPDSQRLIGYREPLMFSVLNADDGAVVFEINGYDRPSWIRKVSGYAVGLLALAGGLGAVVLLSGQQQQRQTKQREQLVDAVASQLGWEHASKVVNKGLPAFSYMQSRPGGHFENLLAGQSLGMDSLLGWYTWVTRSNDSSHTHRELCVLYVGVEASFPDLYLYPESLASKIAALAGQQDVDLDQTPSQTKFSGQYVLRTSQPDRMPAVIHDRLADCLCEHLGWSIEVRDGAALLTWQCVRSFRFESSRSRNPQRVLAFRAEAETIVGLLLKK